RGSSSPLTLMRIVSLRSSGTESCVPLYDSDDVVTAKFLSSDMFQAAEERLRALQLRVPQDFFWRALFVDLALVDEDDAVGGGVGEAHLVRHHDHGHAVH